MFCPWKEHPCFSVYCTDLTSRGISCAQTNNHNKFSHYFLLSFFSKIGPDGPTFCQFTQIPSKVKKLWPDKSYISQLESIMPDKYFWQKLKLKGRRGEEIQNTNLTTLTQSTMPLLPIPAITYPLQKSTHVQWQPWF